MSPEQVHWIQPLMDRVETGTYRDDHLFRSTELLQLPWKMWLVPASECEDLPSLASLGFPALRGLMGKEKMLLY